MVSEEQASEKQCPMIDNLRCIGIACMAWRWYDPPKRVHNPEDWPARRGYCGMAGLIRIDE